MQKSSPKKVLVHQRLVNMEIERQNLHVSIRLFLRNRVPRILRLGLVTHLPTICGHAQFSSIYPIMDIQFIWDKVAVGKELPNINEGSLGDRYQALIPLGDASQCAWYCRPKGVIRKCPLVPLRGCFAKTPWLAGGGVLPHPSPNPKIWGGCPPEGPKVFFPKGIGTGRAIMVQACHRDDPLRK